MDIVSELEQLASESAFIDRGQAEQVIRLVNQRIVGSLAPHIIDVLWASTTEDEIAFSPIVYNDYTSRGGSGSFYVPKNPSSKTGIWTWVYENGKLAWLENLTNFQGITDGSYRFMRGSIKNEATDDEITQRYLSFFAETDSILSIPLIVEDSVRGFYSIEFSTSRILTKWKVETLERISKSMAILLHRIEKLELGKKQTHKKIGSFEQLINQGVPLVKKLRTFLCHASEDRDQVIELYHRLCANGFQPWLDQEDLIAGQDWNEEIKKAVRKSHVVIVCLSNKSLHKSGFIRKEMQYALDVADEQPDGTIFIIPLKLEACAVPERLNRWQWVDFSHQRGYERLMRALNTRADSLQCQRGVNVS